VKITKPGAINETTGTVGKKPFKTIREIQCSALLHNCITRAVQKNEIETVQSQKL